MVYTIGAYAAFALVGGLASNVGTWSLALVGAMAVAVLVGAGLSLMSVNGSQPTSAELLGT